MPNQVSQGGEARSRIYRLLDVARRRERTLIMGVLNITPDSFSDGGELATVDTALARAEQMLTDGADILDIGGESTRPATFRSHSPLPADEEMRRILPVITAIAARFPAVPISVDTYKSEAAAAAIKAGAVFINDISAMRADPMMPAVAASHGVPICLMHMPGLPGSLPADPKYGDVVLEVRDHLSERAKAAAIAGIPRENIVLDPGFGFGKGVQENLALIRRLRELADLGYAVLVGTSRKSTIGKVLGDLKPGDRLEGTAATVALSIAFGAAIVRVHDVREMARVARMSDAIVRG